MVKFCSLDDVTVRGNLTVDANFTIEVFDTIIRGGPEVSVFGVGLGVDVSLIYNARL